ncbi:PhoU family transcriptional regulator [Bacillus coahuilensis m2-6]|uniref:Phosphate-specific transport system accessory protein PhoU n=1 Tax=Bacillus coahuilensis p1.1.43 TaxID=1150625 RepID=A0A147K7D0_9BACI|nr:phosphate signaling complex protein PhoU [Bacillus coahuilensis]KUP05988.1 PhoU family transcriptional regulator [Bacillus coahuilensis p1.1.43]KUP07420.1 PhoU family transcriptional regulator [Bacillus coahuilensis m2-6]
MSIIRGKFEDQLFEVKQKLIDLGNLSVEALKHSIDALDQQDMELALQIMDDDRKLNVLEEEINDLAILLIAKQQPVATDLRRLIVAIKIAGDLERIGDYAVNISKSTIRIGKEPLIKPIVHIRQMHRLTSEMVQLVIDAYMDEDVVKAKKVAEIDDRIDELYGETIQELLALNIDHPEMTSQITQLSFISRYLERAADHVTNISENIIYLVKGKRYDLND